MMLVRTATGSRRHIPPCPHIHGVEVFETDTDELPVCTWCQAELNGEGRTYYPTIEDALRDFGVPAEAQDLIREHLKGITYDSVWIVSSGTYIALGRDGLGVAWAGKTVVYPARGDRVELPGYSPASGGGAELDVRYGSVCPHCSIEMPVTGRCGNCD